MRHNLLNIVHPISNHWLTSVVPKVGPWTGSSSTKKLATNADPWSLTQTDRSGARGGWTWELIYKPSGRLWRGPNRVWERLESINAVILWFLGSCYHQVYCINYEICHPQTSGARDENQSLLTLGSLTASGAWLRGSRLSPDGRHTSYSGQAWGVPATRAYHSHGGNQKLPQR